MKANELREMQTAELTNGVAGHCVRAVLAAMGSPSWGIYNGYELIVHSAITAESSNSKFRNQSAVISSLESMSKSDMANERMERGIFNWKYHASG